MIDHFLAYFYNFPNFLLGFHVKQSCVCEDVITTVSYGVY